MAEYHVGCGIAGIYAGTLKKNGIEWLNKTEVTKEAIAAVIGHMYMKLPEGEKSYAYAVKMKDGKYARLKLEVSDTCPEWAKDVLEGETDDNERKGN